MENKKTKRVKIISVKKEQSGFGGEFITVNFRWYDKNDEGYLIECKGRINLDASEPVTQDSIIKAIREYVDEHYAQANWVHELSEFQGKTVEIW